MLDVPSLPSDWLAIRIVFGFYEHLEPQLCLDWRHRLVEREVAHTALLRANTCPVINSVGKDTHGGHRVAASSASIEGLY